MRLRLRFTKAGKVRWTSHRDLARMFERAFRRTQLPLAYSGGFAPRPKVSFGLALPTGLRSRKPSTSTSSWSTPTTVELTTLPERLSDALPVGVDVVSVSAVDDRAPSLQAGRHVVHVAAARRREPITRNCARRWLSRSPRRHFSSPGNARARSSPMTSVRGSLRYASGTVIEVECELATQPRAVRPAELVRAIDAGLEEEQVRRINQWIERDGARGSSPRRDGAPHVQLAGARASMRRDLRHDRRDLRTTGGARDGRSRRA